MKLKVYLDTSVFSAYYDESQPERMGETAAFWERLSDLEPGTSEVTRNEMNRTPNLARREALLELLRSMEVDSVTEEMRTLARYYVDSGIFTEFDAGGRDPRGGGGTRPVPRRGPGTSSTW